MEPARGAAVPLRRTHTLRLLLALAVTLSAALAAAAGLAARASASTAQVSMIQDDRELLLDPAGTLLRMRQLGAQQVRIAVRWNSLAPNARSYRPPRNFRASDPNAYPAAAWRPYDEVVRDAAAFGIQVNFNVVGGAPLWATGRGAPGHSSWEPSVSAFGSFVRALGVRYSGNYDPAARRVVRGNPADLPRVAFWSIWNEPDYGPSLAPQALPGHRGVEDSPRIYRGLVDAAWGALHATGHGSDQFIIGELAPRSVGFTFGNFNGMLPLVFVRALYCVDAHYHRLRGTAAALRGCPTTAAASRRFARQNPALFHASGFSDHPYMRWYPPNREENSPRVKHFSSLVKQFTTLAVIGNLQGALRRVLAAYGSHVRFPIWNTEFGYITDPPKRMWHKNHNPYVSPDTAAAYDNWAEYLSWRNPQLASFEQYLLEDPLPAIPANNYGGFASGLLAYDSTPKPGFAAWRMPLYMPRTTASSSSQALEVWGAVRPAYYAALDDPQEIQVAQIMFAPSGTSTFVPVDTVPILSPQGYFDVHVRFPASGTARVDWTYPTDTLLGLGGETVSSRTVQVTVK
jgi:hypothetical protein